MPALIDPRIAYVACVMLDTRVDGRYIGRDRWRKAGMPIPATARRIAVRLSEAAEQRITGDEVRAAAGLLTSQIPTYELRAAAGERG